MKPERGRIYRCEVEGQYLYIQFLGRHKLYGDAIRVFPELYPEDQELDEERLETREAYTVFYPLSRAIKEGLFCKTSINLENSPEVPSNLRRRGAVTRDGHVLNWILEGDGRANVRELLTSQERELPLGGVVNHEFLVDRVKEGWHPRDLA